MVFPRWRAVLFAHGCFWHGHDCHLFRMPSTRPEFWRVKIEANRARDAVVERALHQLGWRQIHVWECAMKGRTAWPLQDVIAQCADWLKSTDKRGEIRGRA